MVADIAPSAWMSACFGAAWNSEVRSDARCAILHGVHGLFLRFDMVRVAICDEQRITSRLGGSFGRE